MVDSHSEPPAGRGAASYEAAWADLRRRQTILWIVFLSYLPAVILLSVLADWTLHRSVMLPNAGLWFVVGAIVLSRVRNFQRTRCGNRFYATRWGVENCFGGACANCGLRRGALVG